MPARQTASTRNAKAKASKETTDGTVYGDREEGSLSGNLTRDPELRITPNGRAVASAGVAVNDRVKNDETGEWEDTEPEFYDITVWGEQAERFSELVKGDRIVTVGNFQDETFTNKDGDRVTVTRFTARDIGPSMLWRDVEVKRPTRSKGK